MMIISPAAIDAFRPVSGRLREFYRSGGLKYADDDILLEIERHFGQELARTTCLQLGIDSGACLVLAREIMKSASDQELVDQSQPPKPEIVDPGNGWAKDSYRSDSLS